MAIQQVMVAQNIAVSAGNTDTFSVNDLSNYTEYADTPSNWAIASGKLTAGSGAQAVLTRNSVSFANGYCSCVIQQAEDAGLVLRLTDNNNYYLLVITDASNTQGVPNQFRFFKRVGGTFSAIGASGAISFTRGTSHTVKLEMTGTTINAYFDGSLVTSTTDSDLAGPGLCGPRASTGPNTFDSFSWP